MPGTPAEDPVPVAHTRWTPARTSLVVLILINLFNYIDRYILAAVEPRIREAMLLPDDPGAGRKIGLLGSAFLISYMALAPVFGWLGDRTRRWVIIGCGCMAWSLASGASGFATTFAVLLVTRAFVGLGEAAYGPTAPTIIADLYPVQRRGAVLAWFYMALPVGSALGYAIGTTVASATDSWRWPFYVVVPWGIALGIWALTRPEPARGLSDAATTRRPLRLAELRVLLATPSYVFNLVGMTAMTFAVGGISFWVRTYVNEYRGLHHESQTGLVFGGILVASGLGATLFGGWLSDRLRAKHPGSYFFVSGVGMLVGFPFFLLMLYTPFPLAWVFLFLSTFGLFLNTGPSNTIIANVTHPAMRSSAYAASIFVIHALGDVISPPVIGAICDATRTPELPHGDMNLAFFSVGAAILISGVAWMLGARHLKRDTEQAVTRLETRT